MTDEATEAARRIVEKADHMRRPTPDDAWTTAGEFPTYKRAAFLAECEANAELVARAYLSAVERNAPFREAQLLYQDACTEERDALMAMLERVSHLGGFRQLNDILPEVRALLVRLGTTDRKVLEMHAIALASGQRAQEEEGRE